MKSLCILALAVATMACAARNNGGAATLTATAATSKLLCANPALSDQGFKVTFALGADGAPTQALVDQLRRGGTTRVATDAACDVIDAFDPQLADGAQPQFSCTDPQLADGGFVVELTDGDRAGRRFANVFALGRSSARKLVAKKLSCRPAS